MALVHRINLLGDWERIVTQRLIEQGHRLPLNKDRLKLGIYYCNLEYMRISSVPRKVFISKEFRCPSLYKKRVANLKKMIEKGEDINSFLSKGISRMKTKDYLLYDWNIHHIHLGKIVSNATFSTRTEELLFIFVTKKEVYFLNVLNHDSFEDKDLLSIIHKNWPGLIKPYLLPPNITMTPYLPSESIGLFRKNGISTFTQLDSGELYFPPGRGIVSTSESARAVDSTQKLLNLLHKIEKEIKDNPKKLISKIFSTTGKTLENLNVELKIIGGKFFIRELNANYMEYLFDHEDYININNA